MEKDKQVKETTEISFFFSFFIIYSFENRFFYLWHTLCEEAHCRIDRPPLASSVFSDS